MNYKEVLDFLFSQLPMYQRDGGAAYKSDLVTTLKLDEYFQTPHKLYSTVHIAGTNGKGSVSHMLSAILQNAGYSTGLYTSPHLKDFRERIKINGKMISENYVVQFVEYNQKIIEELRPSFFEITVALAFEYFAHHKVDVAIIETGMGGRLDSTNIIAPEVSVITNIGLDHTQFLGDTIEKIAREKAGIIKPETPVVVGEKQPQIESIYTKTSSQLDAPVVYASERYEIKKLLTKAPYKCQNIVLFDRFIGDETTWEIDLVGEYQAKNLVTTLATMDVICKKFPVKTDVCRHALKRIKKLTGFRGRWDILSQHPLIIADTAHNFEGFSLTMKQLLSIEYAEIHFVLGVTNDKNLNKILNLLPTEAHFYFTKANIPRALNEHILKNKAEIKGLHGRSFASVSDAIGAAKLAAKNNDIIYIGGSTFVVAEAL